MKHTKLRTNPSTTTRKKKAYTEPTQAADPITALFTSPGYVATKQEYNLRLVNLLAWFKKQATLGYTDYNFAIMTSDFNRIAQYLDTVEYEKLGQAWSASYTATDAAEFMPAIDNAILDILAVRDLNLDMATVNVNATTAS